MKHAAITYHYWLRAILPGEPSSQGAADRLAVRVSTLSELPTGRVSLSLEALTFSFVTYVLSVEQRVYNRNSGLKEEL